MRRHLDLESHWTADEQPRISLNLSDDAFDAKMEELLEKYPVPAGYLEDDKKPTFQGFDQQVKSL